MTAYDPERELAHLQGKETLTTRCFDLSMFEVVCPDIPGVPDSADLVLHRFKSMLSAISSSAILCKNREEASERVHDWMEAKAKSFNFKSGHGDQKKHSPPSRDVCEYLCYGRKWFFWDAKLLKPSNNSFVLFINILSDEWPPLQGFELLLKACGANEVNDKGMILNIDVLSSSEKEQLLNRVQEEQPDFDFVSEQSANNNSGTGLVEAVLRESVTRTSWVSRVCQAVKRSVKALRRSTNGGSNK